jgi:hypothetical protein
VGNRNWQEFNEIDITIPSNDTRIFESPDSFITNPAVARYRIDELNETFDVRPSVEELTFGELGLVSAEETTTGSVSESDRNLQLGLDRLNLFDSIDNPENDGQQFTPDDSRQFGTLRISMENTAERTLPSPDASRLIIYARNGDSGEVISTNASARREWIQSFEDVYQSESLEPGENMSGVVGFEIPGEVSEEQISAFVSPVLWRDIEGYEPFYDSPARRVSP